MVGEENDRVSAQIARGIDVIVDVRSHPTSRWEQWQLANMNAWLPQRRFDVEWEPGLGGWTAKHYEEYQESMAEVGVDLGAYSKGAFPKQRIGRKVARKPGQRCADLDPPTWTNQGLYDYAWFTSIPEYQEALQRLVDRYAEPDQPKAAIMCAEALWWKCHRSMVADTLLAIHGVNAMHIKPRAPVRKTTMRWDYHADKIGNRLDRYPEAVRESWVLDKSVSI